MKITESQLKQLIRESLTEVMGEEEMEEGFANNMRGAIQGFRQGAEQTNANAYDANELDWWRTTAKNVLSTGDPQKALRWLQNFVNNGQQNPQQAMQQRQVAESKLDKVIKEAIKKHVK